MSHEAGLQAPSRPRHRPTVAGEAATPPEPGAGRTALLLGLAAGLFFALNIDFLTHGDAAMYANYVVIGKWDDLTLHIGYYAVLAAAQASFGALFGLPIHETMAWLNVACGAAAVAVAHGLALRMLGDRRAALLTAVLYALCGRVVLNATSSEIYMLQTLSLLASFTLFLDERWFVAGIAAGAALLVSPLSAFAFLFFPVADWQRAGRVRLPVWGWTAAGAALLYVPYLAVHGHELLYGRRGLLGIHALLKYNLTGLALNFAKFEVKHFSFLLLLLVPAAWALRAHRRFLVLTLATCLPHLYIISKIVDEDQVFILPTDVFVAAWMALGWLALAARVRPAWLAAIPAAAHAALQVAIGQWFSFEPHRGYGAELRTVVERHLRGRDAVMITDWNVAMNLTFYGRERADTLLEHEPLFRQMYDLTTLNPASLPSLEGRELFLIDTWSPAPLSRLLRSTTALAAMRERHSLRSRAARELGVRCSPLAEGTYPLFSCGRGAPGDPLP